MKIIIRDVEPDDYILAVRAVRWLLGRFQKDAVISYGESADHDAKDFYVRRNKSSITVRGVSRS
jgi:hypothetical protein